MSTLRGTDAMGPALNMHLAGTRNTPRYTTKQVNKPNQNVNNNNQNNQNVNQNNQNNVVSWPTGALTLNNLKSDKTVRAPQPVGVALGRWGRRV